MNRGFYTAAQGMINQQRIIDAISNNVSNVNTACYRKDEIVLNTFQEQLFLVNKRTETAGTSYQTYVDTSKTSLEQGLLTFTGNTFDVGMYGDMYFNIRYEQDPEGRIFQTRNGQWGLDDEGFLWLDGAGRIQGQNGDIYLGTDQFLIDEWGVITDMEGNPIDQLLLTYIPLEADVHKEGNNLFLYEGEPMELPEGEEYVVVQGAYEKSNVDAVKEMTQAMEAHRMYEAASRIIRYFDSMNQESKSIMEL